MEDVQSQVLNKPVALSEDKKGVKNAVEAVERETEDAVDDDVSKEAVPPSDLCQ